MDEPTVENRIDLTARSATMLFAVVYGLGFVIVTVHQARFGIAAFDLLKPKVFAAGITYCALATTAAMTGFFLTRTIRPSEPTEGISAEPVVQLTLFFFRYLWFCMAASVYFPFLFEHWPYFPLNPDLMLLPLLPLVVAAVVWLAMEFTMRAFKYSTPIIFSVAFAASIWIQASVMYNAADRSPLWFALWFFATGWGTLRLRVKLRTIEQRSRINCGRAARKLVHSPLEK